MNAVIEKVCPHCHGVNSMLDDRFERAQVCVYCGARKYWEKPAGPVMHHGKGNPHNNWSGIDSEKSMPRRPMCVGVDCTKCPYEPCIYDKESLKSDKRRHE